MTVKAVTDPRVIDNIAKNFREKIEGKTVIESKPLLCVLSINSRCNLRCAHCPSAAKPYARIGSDPELDMRAFAVIEREVFPYLYGLMFSGTLGEPLIAKNFVEILRTALKYDFFLELATHGHNLRGERLDLLLEKNATIRLSFEGANPKTYEANRGVPMAHLFKIMDNVNKLKQQRNSGLEFLFNLTAWYDNIREFPDLIDLAARYGAPKVAFHHLNPESEKFRYKSLIYHQELTNDMIDEARRRAAKHGIEILGVDKFPEPGTDGYAEHYTWARESREFLYPIQMKVLTEKLGRQATLEDLVQQQRKVMCNFPWEMVAIVENGNMRPCCWTSRNFGNVIKSGFEKIWNGPVYRNLRARINTANVPRFCRDCNFIVKSIRKQLDCSLAQIDGERVARMSFKRFFYIKAHTRVRDFFKNEKLAKSPAGKKMIKVLKNIKHRFFGLDLR